MTAKFTQADLAAAIAAATTDGATPEHIARAVARALTPEQRATAFAWVLPAYISLVGQRASGTHGTPADEGSTPPAGAAQASLPSQTSPRPVARSSKVSLIRDAWAARIEREEFYVDGRRHALRDLTRDQVLAVAAGNRDLAQKVAASADRLERLAEAMAEHGAATVADLPSDVGMAAWRAAA